MTARVLLLILCSLLLAQGASRAQSVPPPKEPEIAAASSEAQAALGAFRLAPELTGSLFAAEPMVANPVAFYITPEGHVFVCESFRQHRGVTDNRNYRSDWVDADLASQTVDDRRAYHERLLGEKAASFMEQDDRIRVLVDTDRDGAADQSHVFASGFNDLVDGTGAGVLKHQDKVYFTCIPNLWQLQDTDGDFAADSRELLHTGYGVRVAFRGHDLHGLCVGPDGRLYFSIGDRGANIQTPAGPVKNVESGSIFRSELDGSKLEIIATGLRNPQELAFDEFGNLFTGDNNSDSGDEARWVYVVEGGDSGWRMAYQYLPDRGPFNREQLWHEFHEGQAAYIVPPVANVSDGPSGLDYYPGTGFSDDFRGRFFLVDFRGTPLQSGVRSFRVEPQGAFFKLVDEEQPIWGMLATDIQFGPDGYLYLSDWVNGWLGEGKGRIYRFASKEHHDDPMVAEVQSLLADTFNETSPERLAELLAHQDQRVRLKAQFELVGRGATEPLATVAERADGVLARLHAIWGLGQIARHDDAAQPEIRDRLVDLLMDPDAEVRAQAVRLLGELGGTDTAAMVCRRLEDASPRVRYFAAQSLGKLRAQDSLDDVVRMLAENKDTDPVIRHGGIMALSGIASDEQLADLSSHPSVAVRIAAAVALRRKESPKVAALLTDENELVVREAARAIHDVPIPEAMPALAALIEQDTDDDALMRRVLNANFRLGGPAHAEALARYATREGAPSELRLEAVEMLGTWAEPGGRDRVLGMWRPLAERDPQPAVAALRPLIAGLANGDSALRLAAARVASTLGIPEAAPVLVSLVEDREVRATQRAEALQALVTMTGSESAEVVRRAAGDRREAVRAAALGLLPEVDPAGAAALLRAPALEGHTLERQAAIAGLGRLPSEDARQVLTELLKQLISDELAPEVQLDALLAARAHSDTTLDSLVAEYEAGLDPERRVDQYRAALHGGNEDNGRQIFFERTSVSCVRCHKVGRRGGEVGPDLSRIGADKERAYLLEALVDPNKTIAEGFASVALIDDSGKTHVGVLREETEAIYTLVDANANVLAIPKDSVEEKFPSQSAMPDDVVTQLTKEEIRDLVEFLASLDGGGFRGFGRRNRDE